MSSAPAPVLVLLLDRTGDLFWLDRNQEVHAWEGDEPPTRAFEVRSTEQCVYLTRHQQILELFWTSPVIPNFDWNTWALGNDATQPATSAGKRSVRNAVYPPNIAGLMDLLCDGVREKLRHAVIESSDNDHQSGEIYLNVGDDAFVIKVATQ